MIVRELITLLGIQTDGKSIKKAQSGFDGLIKQASKLAGAYLSINIAKTIIESASDVNETLNVLNESFGGNVEDVKDWAVEFGNAAGRSQYDMRQMAATLGAVLNPLMERNQDVAAGMSTRLAGLAVDLGSFYNAAEPDVLQALRSGITGEAEPLKRFGIVMNEATLKAFALSEGINKDIKSLTNAEKTFLRYKFILDQTVSAQGDAERTADGWANITKAARGKIKDFGIRIGQSLLPALENAVKWFVKNADKFEFFIDVLLRIGRVVTKVIKWMFALSKRMNLLVQIGLGIVILKWVGAFGALSKALKILLTPTGKIFLLIGLLVLIIEDLIVFVEGGESAFGRLFKILDETTGLDVSGFFKDLLISIRDLADMKEPFDWSKFWDEMVLVMEGHLASAIEFWKSFWNNLPSEVTGFIDWFATTWKTIFSLFSAPFILIGSFIKDVFEVGLVESFVRLKDRIVTWVTDVVSVVTTPLKKLSTLVTSLFGGSPEKIEVEGNVTQTVERKSVVSENINTIENRKLSVVETNLINRSPVEKIAELSEKVPRSFGNKKMLSGMIGLARSAGTPNAPMVPQSIRPIQATARPGIGARSITNSPNTNVEITVNGSSGMDERRLAEEVAKQTSKVIDRKNREAMNALVPAIAGVK